MANRKITVQEKRERRNALLEIMFESEFRSDESEKEIYATSKENREFADDDYISRAYFGIAEYKLFMRRKKWERIIIVMLIATARMLMNCQIIFQNW